MYLSIDVVKSITKTMFCLANKHQTIAPSTAEKVTLHRNGLGEKRVSFPSTASSAVVKDILFEYVFCWFFFEMENIL